MPIIAVLNASGAQAGAIARRLDHAGFEVRRLSRATGEGRIAVDSLDEDSLTRGLEGAWGAAFTTPQDYRPGVREAYAERVARAAERAGIERLVLNTAGPIYEDLDRPITNDLRTIRAILRGGATPTVVIQPTSFFDNLAEPWALPAIVADGVLSYPAAAETRISWISHDSLGDFIAAAFCSDQAVGRIFDVGGPEPITGPELAAAVGAAAGRAVRYAELPLADFAAALNQTIGAPAGDHVASLYAYYRDHPDAGARDPAGWAKLDVTPESASEWAARQDWRVPTPAQA